MLMIYSVSYADDSGKKRSREIIASNEVEVRKALRRQGISPQSAQITEKPTNTASSSPRPGSQEAFRQKLNDANSIGTAWEIASEMEAVELSNVRANDASETKARNPQNPNSFYKILTNDDKPGEYADGDLYEYKHLRLDYKGRGITQEIHILDIDGERVTGWFSGGNVPTLPDILQQLGNAGWKMIGHQVNQDLKSNGVTFHYYNFMRIKKGSKPDRDFPNAVESKNIISTAIESLGG